MSQLEKMARAIFRAHVGFHHVYDANPARKAHWDGIAKAALQSLKDPDEGTLDEALDAATADFCRGDVIGPNDMRNAFTAAINHILKDGEP